MNKTQPPAQPPAVLVIEPTCLYSHATLQQFCGYKTERAFKDFVDDHAIPYFAVQGRWLIRGAAFIEAIAKHELTVAERRSLKAESAT